MMAFSFCFGWRETAPGAVDAWRYRGRPGGSVSAAVLVAEHRAQDHGGDGYGDGSDGDGGQERRQHDAAVVLRSMLRDQHRR